MAVTQWALAIDWDRNNNFTGAQDDVTSRVLSAKWFLGMRQPWQDLADNSRLELVLRNDDRLYSPENTASALNGKVLPQRPVRIQSNDGTTTRTHWVGWIDELQPAVGRNGERAIIIVARGALKFYRDAETKLQLQENKKTSDIIAELIKEVVMPPALSQAWILGRVGNSELGASTYLADTSA